MVDMVIVATDGKGRSVPADLWARRVLAPASGGNGLFQSGQVIISQLIGQEEAGERSVGSLAPC
jgi:hypothetical protein